MIRFFELIGDFYRSKRKPKYGVFVDELRAFAQLPDAQKDERVQKVTRMDRYKARHEADQQRRSA